MCMNNNYSITLLTNGGTKTICELFLTYVTTDCNANICSSVKRFLSALSAHPKSKDSC